MDQIAKLENKAIMSVLMPTFEAFRPHLVANKEAILSIPSETHSYGAHERQKLDLYTGPACSQSSPLFVFFYGGGLSRGSKILPHVPHSLVYHNLGTFYASRGFTTIIADYRRVDDATLGTGEGAVYPSGGEDVAAVIEWLHSKYLARADATQGPRDLFLMGNSAGGVHVSTYLLDERFDAQRRAAQESKSGPLRGAILLSVPMDFVVADPERSVTLNTYWPSSLTDGSASSIDRFCPRGLVESWGAKIKNSSVEATLPKVLLMLGELDPDDEILDTNKRFLSAWKEAFGDKETIEVKWMKGQNHISPPISLMCGDKRGEEWGEDAVSWMRALSTRA